MIQEMEQPNRIAVVFIVHALLFITLHLTTDLSIGQARIPAPSRTATDYSKFSHNTKKHQAACNTCHKVPTSNWQKTSTYPDITDYPGHDACVSCHRSQFFKGAARRFALVVIKRHRHETEKLDWFFEILPRRRSSQRNFLMIVIRM